MRSHFSFEIPFIGHRRQFLGLSCILVVLAVVGLLIRGLVFGIEFRGGTEMDFRSTGDVTIEQMRGALESVGEGSATVQTAVTEGEPGFLVRSDTTDPATANAHAADAASSLGLAADSYTVTTIGPDWGADVTRSSAAAFAVAILAIILYVTVRYEFKMSLTAVCALLHDLVITLGVYAWFQIAISPNVVAALLTIMGYSLYDTVVEFNRMDENARQLKDGVHRTYYQICNFSINEVFVRSINTTITTHLYVEREGKQLKPTVLGEVTTELMKEHFPNILDVKFTAEMENNLDDVERGKKSWVDTLEDFYGDFSKTLETAEEKMEGKRVKVPDEETDIVCDQCGRNMVIKIGRYGRFLACPGFPECKNTKKIVQETAGSCPLCNNKIILKKSKRGRSFYGCSAYPDCNFMTWNVPTEEKCPQCGCTLFQKGGKSGTLVCEKPGCGYSRPVGGA